VAAIATATAMAIVATAVMVEVMAAGNSDVPIVLAGPTRRSWLRDVQAPLE